MSTSHKKNIAVFASGTGTNAANIIQYFQIKHKQQMLHLIVCNNPQAGVLKIAEAITFHTLIIEKEKFFKGDGLCA